MRRLGSGRKDLRLCALLLSAALLSACGSAPRRGTGFPTDGPLPNPPADLQERPDPIPRIEPIRAATSRPYSVLGRDYVPMTALAPYRERGLASWYGRKFHGMPTASGEIYDMYQMTAAHPTLPIPSYARVSNPRNGRSVIVRINDRGPFHDGRIIDLSYAAAVRLDKLMAGTVEVELELLLPDEIARLQRAPQKPSELAAPVDGLFVQLGVYAQRANADAMRERLMQASPEHAAHIEIVPRGNAFSVLVGPFLDPGDAALAQVQLGAALNVEPVITDRR